MLFMVNEKNIAPQQESTPDKSTPGEQELHSRTQSLSRQVSLFYIIISKVKLDEFRGIMMVEAIL